MIRINIITLYLVCITYLCNCSEINKCCGNNEILQKTNSSFECVTGINQRWQFLNNSVDFSKKSEITDNCYDVTSDSKFVKLLNGTLDPKFSLTELSVFPKCCPLGYYYYTKTHSCVKSENLSTSFINETVIKVGLPECTLIIDDIFDNYTGIDRQNRPDEYCVDENESKGFVVRRCESDRNYCRHNNCLRKCCPDGQSFVRNKTCVDTFVHGVNLTLSVPGHVENSNAEDYAILHNYKEGDTCDILIRLKPERIGFTLANNGVMYVYFNRVQSSYEFEFDMKKNVYCLENADDDDENITFYICPIRVVALALRVDTWLHFTSCIFFFLTILVYILVKKLHNLFGKALIFYCSVSCAHSAVMFYLLFEWMDRNLLCTSLGYLLSYLGYSQFAWLSAISWNIYKSFGSTKSNKINQKADDRKSLLYYILFGFGLPLILISTVFLFNNVDWLPVLMRPTIGVERCEFDIGRGRYGKIVFNEIPLTILVIVNIVLFAKTVMYCLKVKSEIRKLNDGKDLQDKYKVIKEKIFVVLKLLIVMGVSFITDVAFGYFYMNGHTITRYIEVVGNIVNYLQGLYIFIIFVCKKKILDEILLHLRLKKITHAGSSTTASTFTGSRQSISSATPSYSHSQTQS